MKSGRQTVVVVAVFIFLTVFITVSGRAFSLLPSASTNSSSQNYNWTNVPVNSTTPHIYGTNLIPLIELRDVPITYALQNIAPEAGINYILDQETGYGEPDSLGERKQEPLVNFRRENVTAAYAFMEICTNYNLTVIHDLQTGVVLVRTRDHDVNFVKANLNDTATNIIPLVLFKEVPLSFGLKNLAKQAGIKCILSPKIDTGQPDSEPKVNIRWENITAGKAFAAVCESCDLEVTKYPDSGIIHVEPAD